MRDENREKQSYRRATDEQAEQKQNQPQENVSPAEIARGLVFHGLVLARIQEAFACPVLQLIARMEGFFAGCVVSSHCSLPKRRAIATSSTSMPMPVTTK